jgi:hypothetical protein
MREGIGVLGHRVAVAGIGCPPPPGVRLTQLAPLVLAASAPGWVVLPPAVDTV